MSVPARAAPLGKANQTQQQREQEDEPTLALNQTWNESLALLNTRPHPLIASLCEPQDSADSDEPSTDEDECGAARKAARDEFERRARGRWEYFAPREGGSEAEQRRVERMERMGEDCELLSAAREATAKIPASTATEPANGSVATAPVVIERSSPPPASLPPPPPPPTKASAPARAGRITTNSQARRNGVLVLDSDEDDEGAPASAAAPSTGLSRRRSSRMSLPVATAVSATPRAGSLLPASSSAVAISTKADTSTTSARTTAKTKAGKTSVQYLDSLKTSGALSKHKAQYPTISLTLDYLNTLAPPIVHKPLFEECKIVLVNHLSVKASKLPNAFDVAHRLQMSRLIAHGAVLVKPEEFKSAGVTHVVPLEIEHSKGSTFDQVLDLLGEPHQRIGIRELGDVRVVKFAWVTASLQLGQRLSEASYIFPGDPRTPPSSPKKRGGSGRSSPQKRAKRSGRTPDSADEASTDEERHQDEGNFGDREDGGVREEDTTMEDDIDEGESFRLSDQPSGAGAIRRVPTKLGERQALEFGAPTQLPQSAAISGLERELAMVSELGEAAVDQVLDAAESDSDLTKSEADELYVFSTREEDNETDEEEDEEERDKKKDRQERIKAGGFRTSEGRYACDRVNTGGVGADASPNERTAKVLDAMAELWKKDKMRQRAYRIAAGALRNRADKIETFEEAVAIRGIGRKIALKIVEINKTGTLRRLRGKTEREKCVEMFANIFGVGSKIGEDLFDLGCRSLNDVRTIPASKGRPLTAAQQLGLQYYDHLLRPIPRAEVTAFHRLAAEAAATIDPQLQVLCMGSYIRGAAECGDVDFIVTRNTADGRDHTGMIKKLWQKLQRTGMIRHSLLDPNDWERLDVKYNGLCALPGPGATMRRIDILGVPWEELPAARIYFTGNDFFNRSMRLKAGHMGLRLNQRGLWQDAVRGKNKEKLTQGIRVPGVKTERDIFRVLEVPWREPHERLP